MLAISGFLSFLSFGSPFFALMCVQSTVNLALLFACQVTLFGGFPLPAVASVPLFAGKMLSGCHSRQEGIVSRSGTVPSGDVLLPSLCSDIYNMAAHKLLDFLPENFSSV